MLFSDHWGLSGRKTAGQGWGKCAEARGRVWRQMGSVLGQAGKGWEKKPSGDQEEPKTNKEGGLGRCGRVEPS